MKNNKKSQTSEILRWLEEYGSITSQEAIKYFGATRLSGIIFNLREMGYKITTEKATMINRYGHLTHYAIYHLESEE